MAKFDTKGGVMRLLKFLVVVCFIVITTFFAKNWYKEQHSDKGVEPEITFKHDIIDVSIEEYEKQLLSDVSATDEQDGDLTSQVVVESISKFVDKKEHICNITSRI